MKLISEILYHYDTLCRCCMWRWYPLNSFSCVYVCVFNRSVFRTVSVWYSLSSASSASYYLIFWRVRTVSVWNTSVSWQKNRTSLAAFSRSLYVSKRGSRHAAHAAKALRWRVDQLLRCLIKKITLSSLWYTLCLDPPLVRAQDLLLSTLIKPLCSCRLRLKSVLYTPRETVTSKDRKHKKMRRLFGWLA